MQTQYKTDTVLLEGFQAILKASEYGYSMSIAVEDAAMIEKLEEERADELKYQESKLKNPRRKTVNPEPWEEVANGKYILKFRWDEKKNHPLLTLKGPLSLMKTFRCTAVAKFVSHLSKVVIPFRVVPLSVLNSTFRVSKWFH